LRTARGKWNINVSTGSRNRPQGAPIWLTMCSVKRGAGAPPASPLFKDDFSADDFEGVKAMDVKILAERAMNRVAPNFILKQLSKSVDNMLAQTKG
jgi:hypothetical protein